MQTDDRIQPVTRIVAVIVVPFLWLAFLILFFNPDSSGARFAWAIKPHMTAMYMAAGYLGGSWIFINAIFGKRWHRIAGGFLPITTFTWFMMIATFLHWDKFAHGRLGFNLWLILYILTPFLVPILWNYNRKTDSGEPESNDVLISPSILLILKLISVGSLIYVLVGFINPEFVINTWPWTLSALTARVMCGWIALLSVGAYTMSIEKRWSGWKNSTGEYRHLAHPGIRRHVHESIRFQNGIGQLVHDFHWRDADRNICLLSDDGNEETKKLALGTE